MTAYKRQKEKCSAFLAVDVVMPPGDKIFANFLILMQVCRRPSSQKGKTQCVAQDICDQYEHTL